jgi:hypothetical protein
LTVAGPRRLRRTGGNDWAPCGGIGWGTVHAGTSLPQLETHSIANILSTFDNKPGVSFNFRIDASTKERQMRKTEK